MPYPIRHTSYDIWRMGLAYAPALNLKSQISNPEFPPCDLCGSTESDLVLTTPRLDGPLARCRDCGLFYVVLPERERPGRKSSGARRRGEILGSKTAVNRSRRRWFGWRNARANLR